ADTEEHASPYHASPPSTFHPNVSPTGTLSMTRSGSDTIFNASPMKIGDSVTGSVTINNTGTLAGIYTLSGSTSGDAALGSQLNLKVYKDVDGVSPIYDGSLGGFSSVSLGTFAARGGSHVFYFHVTLPTTGTDAGDNLLQGLSSSTAFNWSATQA